MLELRDLTVSYGRGKVVLHEITLAFGSGELAVIMGHNGAGKTTLLKAIFGLLAPERGEIRYQGEPLRGDAPGRVRRRIAYSPAGQAILPGLTAAENLAVAAEVVRADQATTRSPATTRRAAAATAVAATTQVSRARRRRRTSAASPATTMKASTASGGCGIRQPRPVVRQTSSRLGATPGSSGASPVTPL